MVVKKFFGKTTRDALRQVREELGADALILSNRPTVGGDVEIMAMADADVANLASSLATTSSSRHPPRHAPTNHPQRIGNTSVNRALARTYAAPDETRENLERPQREAAFPEVPMRFAPPPYNEPLLHTKNKPAFIEIRAKTAAGIPAQPTSTTKANELKEVEEEIKLLRSLLQSQLASFAWSDLENRAPNRIELLKQLLAMGLSSHLSRQLIDKMPAQYEGETALKWARSALLHNLKCADESQNIIDRGGVFALVGPTGVGKTSTVAKLAARATKKFGPHNVALVTTDNYRIGAQDQLRMYGKILGVPVFSIQNDTNSQLPLSDLVGRRNVFIDTASVGHNSPRLLAQTEIFTCAGMSVERILVMAANADGHTLEDVVKRYRGSGLAGCIMTKIDESVVLGAMLDVIIRNRLKVYYITNGQRVPEDLHPANGNFLIDRALRAPQHNSPFTLQADEYSVMSAAHAGWL